MLKVLRDKWSVRQKGVVLLAARVLLCLAGAGAGKTTVLVERVAYFIRRGLVAAAKIYLTTFSRKAAAMLNARIRQAAGVDIHASTIHSLALEVIQSAQNAEADAEPVVLNERAQARIVSDILRDHPARNTIEPFAMVSRISWWKAHGFTANAIRQLYPSDPQAHVFALYERAKGSALDFCDLITRATDLLEHNTEIRGLWHERVKYLAIDELQDTNPLELRFLTQIAASDAFVFAVGDPDQGIYQFQGSDITNSLHFDRFFPGAVLLTLTENRRSTSTILACAQLLIEKNKGRYPKALTPVRPAGPPVAIVNALDWKEEREFVAAQIRAALAVGVQPREIAVLARTRELVAAYTAYLGGQGFAVARHRYDQDFWTKPTVARAVAVIAAVAGTASAQDWELLLAHLPQADRIAILRHSQEQQATVQALADTGALVQTTITVPGQAYVAKLLAVLSALRHCALHELGHQIRKQCHDLGFLEGKGACAAEDAQADLAAFADAVTDQCHLPGVSSFGALHGRLATPLVTDSRISVLTAHTVKGLEFEWVFVVGCEDGLFPHFYAINTNVEDMEEERRLFYVAMTRAKDRLFLLHAQKRWHGGVNRRKYPSRFLTEIGTEGVEKIDACVALKGRATCTSPSTSIRP